MDSSGPVDPQRAFRAGLLGWRYGSPAEPAVAGGFAFGPNEQQGLAFGRLPGLSAARPAFECGRAVRAILRLLDQVRAPPHVGGQFLGNIAAACLAHRTRQRGRAWGAEDTVAMFMELYERVLPAPATEQAAIAEALLAYARDEATALPGAQATAAQPGR